jgi:hypothetical protein
MSFELPDTDSRGSGMARKHRAHDQESWTHAKKICRLNVRQLEMARRLGLNPKKLPGLRPSPQQRWKLPMGAFIEELYWKRFGGNPVDHQSNAARARRPDRVKPPDWQLGDLVCYLTNLCDDLQKWLGHDEIDREVVSEVAQELRKIASALETGAFIDPIPCIPLAPRRTYSRRDDEEPPFDDDIPF